MVTYHFFLCKGNTLVLIIYFKKSEKFLEKNFVYGQISKILLEFLLNPCDILKFKIFLIFQNF